MHACFYPILVKDLEAHNPRIQVLLLQCLIGNIENLLLTLNISYPLGLIANPSKGKRESADHLSLIVICLQITEKTGFYSSASVVTHRVISLSYDFLRF